MVRFFWSWVYIVDRDELLKNFANVDYKIILQDNLVEVFFCYFSYLVSVTAGEPVSPWGHM